MLPLSPHVPSAEDGSGHGDERGEHRKVDIEGVNKEELSACKHRALQIDLKRKTDAGHERCSRTQNIDLGRELPVTDKGECSSATAERPVR